MINCGTSMTANGAVDVGVTVWRYLFTALTPGSPYFNLNATHVSEVPYVFNNPTLLGFSQFTPEVQTLADRIVAYWKAFHETSNPNSEKNKGKSFFNKA